MAQETSESKLPVLVSTDSLELPALAAGIVHEVKNPLAAIHLHLQLLESYANEIEDEELRGKIIEKVRIIKKEILTLNQTLQEFIRLIRPVDSIQQSGNIETIIKDVVRLLEIQAKRQDILISFNPGQINLDKYDPSFIRQILINLVLNAIQAFEEDSQNGKENLSEDTKEKCIEISTGVDSSGVYLRVRDNASGIPPEIQEKIFDPFFTTKPRGSGLGLALVRKMVIEMGGSISIQSSPGKGTEFTVYMNTPLIAESNEDSN